MVGGSLPKKGLSVPQAGEVPVLRLQSGHRLANRPESQHAKQTFSLVFASPICSSHPHLPQSLLGSFHPVICGGGSRSRWRALSGALWPVASHPALGFRDSCKPTSSRPQLHWLHFITERKTRTTGKASSM